VSIWSTGEIYRIRWFFQKALGTEVWLKCRQAYGLMALIC